MSAATPSPSPAWSTKIWPGATFGENHSYHGDVFHGLNCLCHISLSGAYADEATGRTAVAASALKWIHAYEDRNSREPKAS